METIEFKDSLGVKVKLMQGDCRERLKELPDDSIDLIVTSPPYADSRKKTYGGLSPDAYWTRPLKVDNQLRHILP